MLKKVVSINGLGLLHSSGPSPVFDECTLLFADNGRGKSTFTSLLESLRTGDMAEITRLQTIDQTSPIQAKLVFGDGPNTSEIVSGSWDHLRPNVRVFDSRFVRENVYSGSLVESSHRRNLLTFVLGDSAVTESDRERRATEALALALADVRAKESSLAPFLNGTTLNEFIAFLEDSEIDSKIAAVDQDIQNHQTASDLLAQPEPSNIGLLDPGFDEVFDTLARGMEELNDSAALLVQQHLSDHPQGDFEAWVRAGSEFTNDETCPYCRQSISGVDLIAAYRHFFSEQYFEHIDRVNAMFETVGQSVGPDAVQAVTRRVAIELSIADWWKSRAQIEELQVDVEQYQEQLGAIWALLSDALNQKVSAPLTGLDVQDVRTVVADLWAQVEFSFALLNDAINRNSAVIRILKGNLAAGDLPALEIARARLEAQRIRHTPSVAAIADALVVSRGEAARHEEERDAARANVRSLMDGTLSRYESEINSLLSTFGAGFSVREMRTNFRGASPQSDYVIMLRDREVPLKSDAGPNFDTALSEGDKRTLAFAFFVACIVSDADVADMVVAVDDPMSSMDAGRRRATIGTLVDIQSQASQLILSSHDPVFLREYRKALLRKTPSASIAEMQLCGGLGDYSDWSTASLDELSESSRRKMIREVESFVATGHGDAQAAATNIRTMLEGYLHARYPTLLKDGLLLGECLTAIRAAADPSPLVFAQNIVDEIETINSYAGDFHHDGTAGYVRPSANREEALHWASRALRLIYGGTVST